MDLYPLPNGAISCLDAPRVASVMMITFGYEPKQMLNFIDLYSLLEAAVKTGVELKLPTTSAICMLLNKYLSDENTCYTLDDAGNIEVQRIPAEPIRDAQGGPVLN